MSKVFLLREVSELENGSVILMSDKLYTIKQLKYFSGLDNEPDRYEFLAVPGNMAGGDENRIGKRITVPAGYVFTVEEEQTFSFLQITGLACFFGGTFFAACIYFLDKFINT